MDAKTLRAAVAAALRVTVSTSLIGCGAHTTTDGASGGTASHATAPGAPRTDDEPHPAPVEPSAGKPGREHDDPAPVATAGASSGASTGGTSTGGAGGMTASAAGAGDGGAPALPLTACEAIEACMTQLEGMTFEFGQPPPSAATECCQVLIEGLTWQTGSAVCEAEVFSELDSRFMQSAARGSCCASQDTWQNRACTPWGPAVPPELPLAALTAWELAA